MICDAHIHFFSPGFIAALAAQKGVAYADAVATLGWEDPESAEALADRWAAELDRAGVARAGLIASVPGDAASVGAAIGRHPDRFVGFFMVDPTAPNAAEQLAGGFGAGLRTACLFPAMHRYALGDPRVRDLFATVASAGGCVFVHCGELSIGARTKLGLPSAFDMTRGAPADLEPLARAFPGVPIVIPHFGAGRLDEALALARACGNVHLDTSSSNGWIAKTPGLTLAEVFARALDAAGPDRLLFGTDSSFFPRGWNRAIYDAQIAALDTLRVDAGVKARIVGGNFARLFP